MYMRMGEYNCALPVQQELLAVPYNRRIHHSALHFSALHKAGVQAVLCTSVSHLSNFWYVQQFT